MQIFRSSLVALLSADLSLAAAAQPNAVPGKRVVYYYQTQYSNGSYVSLAPLSAPQNLDAQGHPYTTDVLVGAFHLGQQSDGSRLHLNNDPPSAAKFHKMFQETAALQAKGTNVNLFLGGYQDGSFKALVSDFATYYPVLKNALLTYKFNGIDLDVEDGAETTAEIETLIDRLRRDFGPSFIITLAPTALDLASPSRQGGLSLINYAQLYTQRASSINWYNVQFYNGFGSFGTTSGYDQITKARAAGGGGFPPPFIVAGVLSNPANGSGGYIDYPALEANVKALVAQHPRFGGVDAFEYFNANPGGTAHPAQWGTGLAHAMGR